MRNWALFVFLVMFLGSSLYWLFELRARFERDINETRGTHLWLATEVNREYWRFLDSLSRYSLGDAQTSHDDLMLRFDIFWSQTSNFQSGSIGQRLMTDGEAVVLIDTIVSKLREIESAIEALEHGDAQTGYRLRQELAGLGSQIHQMAQRVDKAENTYFVQVFNNTETSLNNLSILFLLLVATGSLLILLLAQQTMRSSNLYKKAQRAESQLKELNNSLEQKVTERTAALEAEIAERRIVESELRHAEERFRQIFEHADAGNIVINEQGTIESVNPAAKDIFGYDENELVGQNVSMLMPSAERNMHDGYLQKYLQTGERNIIGIGREVTGRRKNGEEFPLHLGIGEFFKGSERFFIGSINDLTEYRQLENQLHHVHRLDAVGQLTGGIAHDFNNLLAVIIGNAELLQMKLNGAQSVKKNVDTIIEAGNRGASLTSQLLSFSRKQSLSPIHVDLPDVIGVFEDMIRRTLGETIDLLVEHCEEPWPVRVDPHQLQNALINLSINAKDAMPNGGKLMITTENLWLNKDSVLPVQNVAPGDYVKVSVKDSGVGIAKDIIDRVFEPFFTTKDIGKGSGLGLSMVYGFVKQSNGYIDIHSQVGEGTSVELFLPRSEDTKATNRNDSTKADLVSRGGKVLLVEDDADVRHMASTILTENGFEIVEACDAHEAIRLYQQQGPFDLLFTDVVLPFGMNGIELAEGIRRQHPQLKVLFTSGYAEESIEQTGGTLATDNIISKPYRFQELLDAVNATLRRDEVNEVD